MNRILSAEQQAILPLCSLTNGRCSRTEGFYRISPLTPRVLDEYSCLQLVDTDFVMVSIVGLRLGDSAECTG
jgi:hypothetical protein